MAKTVYERAYKAYARSSWAEVIRLLEPMVVHNRDSFRFYRLLGLSCLRSGDVAGAGTYLRRAAQLSPGNEEIELALAALELRRRDLPSAVEAYLEVLEAHPGSRLARQALDFLKKRGDDDSINELVDSGKIEAFYPGKPSKSPLIPIVAMALAIGAIALAVSGLKFAFRPREPRLDVQSVRLSGRELEKPIQDGGTFRFILTEKEAVDAFERCKRLFQDYRDNEAVKEANKLLLSNASVYIKEKARQLKGLTQQPSFKNLKDNPSFKEVMISDESQALHDGCAVIWKGRLANVKSADSLTRFDFLVGYHDRKTLEGIIPVVLNDSMGAIDDSPVELLAWIRYRAGATTLEGIALHDLSYSGLK